MLGKKSVLYFRIQIIEISPEDMKKLDGLRGASKLANDPDEVNF